VDPKRPNFIDPLKVMDESPTTIPESKVRPPKEGLDHVMQFEARGSSPTLEE
jgi:hypothetical protein